MRKGLITIMMMLAASLFAVAQKYAPADTEYILKNIPDYEMTNEQLDAVSKKWGEEVKKLQFDAETMYKKYQSDLVYLSAAQKKEREDAIVKKEQEATELQTKYFGPEGELYKKRNELMKPIQDEIWNAIKEIAKNNNFYLVLDRATSGIIYANPGIDISDSVLKKLGYAH